MPARLFRHLDLHFQRLVTFSGWCSSQASARRAARTCWQRCRRARAAAGGAPRCTRAPRSPGSSPRHPLRSLRPSNYYNNRNNGPSTNTASCYYPPTYGSRQQRYQQLEPISNSASVIGQRHAASALYQELHPLQWREENPLKDSWIGSESNIGFFIGEIINIFISNQIQNCMALMDSYPNKRVAKTHNNISLQFKLQQK